MVFLIAADIVFGGVEDDVGVGNPEVKDGVCCPRVFVVPNFDFEHGRFFSVRRPREFVCFGARDGLIDGVDLRTVFVGDGNCGARHGRCRFERDVVHIGGEIAQIDVEFDWGDGLESVCFDEIPIVSDAVFSAQGDLAGIGAFGLSPLDEFGAARRDFGIELRDGVLSAIVNFNVDIFEFRIGDELELCGFGDGVAVDDFVSDRPRSGSELRPSLGASKRADEGKSEREIFHGKNTPIERADSLNGIDRIAQFRARVAKSAF